MGGGLFSRISVKSRGKSCRFSTLQLLGMAIISSLLITTTPVFAVTDNLNSALVGILDNMKLSIGAISNGAKDTAVNISTLNSKLDIMNSYLQQIASDSSSSSNSSGNKIKAIYQSMSYDGVLSCNQDNYPGHNNIRCNSVPYLILVGDKNVSKCQVVGEAYYTTNFVKDASGHYVPAWVAVGDRFVSSGTASNHVSTWATYKPFQVIEYE